MADLPDLSQFTVEEYLLLDRTSHVRREYIDGHIYAMAGAGTNHITISGNAAAALRKPGCRVWQSDMKVRVDAAKYLYPDVVMVCGTARFHDHPDSGILLNPTLIVEVLSDSTQTYDMTVKLAMYRQLASLQEYLVIYPHQPVVKQFTRLPDDAWIMRDLLGLASVVSLGSFDHVLPLAALYQDVTLPPGGE